MTDTTLSSSGFEPSYLYTARGRQAWTGHHLDRFLSLCGTSKADAVRCASVELVLILDWDGGQSPTIVGVHLIVCCIFITLLMHHLTLIYDM